MKYEEEKSDFWAIEHQIEGFIYNANLFLTWLSNIFKKA